MAFAGQTPTIIVLKEGTDASQGKGQIISNINACVAVQSTIKSTLGPYGGDLLLVDSNGKQTITNDGATVMKLLDIVHPAARILTDIARSQDAEVGDGTTSVVVLAGEILKEVRELVEQGVSAQTIIKGLRRGSAMAVNKVKEIAVDIIQASESEEKKVETLRRLAGTAMNSKLIKRNADFFTKMVVDAVLSLDQDDLNEKLIGVKKVTGGGLQDSLFVNGVAFKKTFSYAGFEQQPKSFKDPKIVCLNVELELKSEKDNAEVRVEQVSEYQAIVDAEWQIIYNKLEAIYKTGAKVVLSKLPIGDLATQYVLSGWSGSVLIMPANRSFAGTSRTATSSVPAVSRRTIWTACARPPARPRSRRAVTSRNVTWVPAARSRSARSVESGTTCSPNAPAPRRVLWCCVVVPSSSSPRSSVVCTTPS
ncbi:T-complex protein 1 subunit eta, variant 2 [Aspergillus melleus]|uniref:T-complex protein 1 subunit eta, variant 2 n=1 Tax=Aspergillus melleus TaxID=138277 RepID=UPI001E8E4EF0|nr:T-complex protein 1 subunit eta, variant 2 [Aspergillus melleus]KAH8422779.1 T-complex protein 1 subunit eta, variant 2 [Aspergillus melleus]